MSILLNLILETVFPISVTQTVDSWDSHNKYLGVGDSEQDIVSPPQGQTKKKSVIKQCCDRPRAECYGALERELCPKFRARKDFLREG